MIYSFCFKFICDYLPVRDLLRLQTLNRQLYQVFMPKYFTMRPRLSSAPVTSKNLKEAILLFQDVDSLYKTSYDERPKMNGKRTNTELKWKEQYPYLTMVFSFHQHNLERRPKFSVMDDWSKIIHLSGSKWLITGGSRLY